MSHLFLLDLAIQQGEIISMPADRIFGSQKSVTMKLLGAEVRLPLGPFSVATMRGLNVLTVNVMKTATNSYKIYVKPLDYDKQSPRRQQISQLAQGYAAELERILTMYPTQWYNYFEYWNVEH
jgi:predicted LPLAT superfamily acyltransferase